MQLKTIGNVAYWLRWISLVAAVMNVAIFWGANRYVIGTGVGFAFMLYYANFLRKRSLNELASWMGNVILPNESNLDPFLPWLGVAIWVVVFVCPQYWYLTT
jgi:hypothetical protein